MRFKLDFELKDFSVASDATLIAIKAGDVLGVQSRPVAESTPDNDAAACERDTDADAPMQQDQPSTSAPCVVVVARGGESIGIVPAAFASRLPPLDRVKVTVRSIKKDPGSEKGISQLLLRAEEAAASSAHGHAPGGAHTARMRELACTRSRLTLRAACRGVSGEFTA